MLRRLPPNHGQCENVDDEVLRGLESRGLDDFEDSRNRRRLQLPKYYVQNQYDKDNMPIYKM